MAKFVDGSKEHVMTKPVLQHLIHLTMTPMKNARLIWLGVQLQVKAMEVVFFWMHALLTQHKEVVDLIITINFVNGLAMLVMINPVQQLLKMVIMIQMRNVRPI